MKQWPLTSQGRLRRKRDEAGEETEKKQKKENTENEVEENTWNAGREIYILLS